MQSGINLKVCKRTGRAGPIVTLKCMEISMANHVMGYGAPKTTLIWRLKVFSFAGMRQVDFV